MVQSQEMAHVHCAGTVAAIDRDTLKDQVQIQVRRYLVLVLDSHKGSSIYELLCNVGESPEAGVVHCGVAVLVHKVHVRLVPEQQLHNLVGIILM